MSMIGIYKTIFDTQDSSTQTGKIYSFVMILAIFISLVPLVLPRNFESEIIDLIEYICGGLFILDYLFRWVVADKESSQIRIVAFLLYPLRITAIIDLLSILPVFTPINISYKLLRIIRLLRIMRLLKIFRYSNRIQLFVQAIRSQSQILYTVFGLALLYIFMTACIMYNVDMKFETFFDALYWATTTLTTVGYGDIYPHNALGRLLSMVSSLIGVAIIALPSGVITAAYLDALKDGGNEEEKSVSKQ